MPNQESVSEKLMNFLTSPLNKLQLDFIDELTTMFWAEGKTLEKSVEQIRYKYGLSSLEMLECVRIVQLVDFIHDQECQANIKNFVR